MTSKHQGDVDYNEYNRTTNVQIDRIAMSLRFVVDLTPFILGGKYRPGDDMSPGFVCVRDLSIPFGLLPFDVPIFPMPPAFAPDARLPGPCVNTTNVYTWPMILLFVRLKRIVYGNSTNADIYAA